MKKQIVVHGMSFNEGTNEKVIEVLSMVQKDRRRVRVWFGDVLTGKSWDEENDVCGYIGKSTGMNKIPLLIHNEKSFGGGALLCDSIVKIVDTKSKVIYYQHENFSQSNFTEQGCQVLKDGQTYATCENETKVRNLRDFMNGDRMHK
jgi:hypothetical protein